MIGNLAAGTFSQRLAQEASTFIPKIVDTATHTKTQNSTFGETVVPDNNCILDFSSSTSSNPEIPITIYSLTKQVDGVNGAGQTYRGNIIKIYEGPNNVVEDANSYDSGEGPQKRATYRLRVGNLEADVYSTTEDIYVYVMQADADVVVRN